MTQEELLNTLGIVGKRAIEDSRITVSSSDSNLYSNWYTILDNSDLVELVPEATVMDMDETKLVYVSYDYRVTIQGDLENNVYKLIVEEL